MKIKLKQQWKVYGGTQYVYSHKSQALQCDMEFSVFIPLCNEDSAFPSVYYLSGLTCNWENAVTKANAQKYAAENQLILIFPDTSPRGVFVDDKKDDYQFGQGAGFYLNATEKPWSKHYRMYDYITEELPQVIEQSILQVDQAKRGIMGHSMGGHGALTIALKNQDYYHSLSAFAPIVAPTQVENWGKKALSGYLGNNPKAWNDYDACQLVKKHGWKTDILIDQGAQDQFLHTELKPELFIAACEQADVDLTYRSHGGYDHSYYFISSFMADHMHWHAERLYL